MINEDFRSSIEETEFYRGQIVYRWKRPQVSGASGTLQVSEFGKFNPYSSYDKFFKHQKDLVDELKNGKNVLFLSPFNTGKTTISLLFALDVLFNKHRSVLFICQNSFEKDLEKNLLDKILIESRLDWLVNIHDIKQEIDKEEFVGSFPTICIAEAKDLHAHLLPNHSKYSSLFESLGLIIYDDFEKFSGNLASNIHFVNKRLDLISSIYNKDTNPFQYLVLSKPFKESKSIVESIFERNFEIIYRDDKEINPSKIFYWIPAFDKVDILPGGANTLVRTTKRDSFIDDTYILAIESLKKRKKTIVYYANIPLSKDDIKKREIFLNWTSRYGDFDLDAQTDLIIAYDWSDMTLQIVKREWRWEEIDTIIIALFSGSIKELRDYFLHIGNSESEIFITMPQTPFFQYEINHPSLEIIKDSKEIAKGETESIFAFSRAESLIEKHRMVSAYELRNLLEDEILVKFKNKWKVDEDQEKVFEISESYCKKLFKNKGYDIFSTEAENFFVLIDPNDNIISTIDRSQIPDSYFKRAIVCNQNQRYEVDDIDLENKKIKLKTLGNFAQRISLREMRKNSEGKGSEYNYSNINFNMRSIDSSANFNAYKTDSGTDTHPGSFIPAGSKNDMELKNIKISGVELSGFNNPKAFANIFDIGLSTKISLYNLIPYYFIDNGKSFFYNLGNDDFNYLVNDENIKLILERALTILIDCPCQSGCAGCLENFKVDSSDLSKKELMEFLGKILKKDNLDSIIRWKYEAIGLQETLREDMIKFKEVKEKVLQILESKANMIINNPYDGKFISDDDAKWIGSVGGLCHGEKKTVYIMQGCEEAIFTDICAHEYTHNWQGEGNLNSRFRSFDYYNIENESNIWFEGKLFAEGQANFFAAKVMDYFGLRKMIYRDEYGSYGQYREGLILMNYLEKKFGLQNLNFILKEGVLKTGNPVSLIDINTWYDESGIKDLVRGEADKLLKNNENMSCLQYEFMHKTLDLHRITYHINHRVFPQSPTLLDKIKEAQLNEDESFSKIWEILKKHFNITPKKGYDYLPCKNCAYKEHETLDGLCMMFGSISVKEKIMKKLGLDQ